MPGGEGEVDCNSGHKRININAAVNYAYEAPLSDGKGVTIHPDFTIEDTDTGITYYW